ncbi:MAG TPA: hypothetical protein VIJ66_11560 [Solirubrobacteraceae bacterium]
MSRLGAALAAYIQRLSEGVSEPFVSVEGVSRDVAEGISRAWPDGSWRLAIASDEPDRFGDHALRTAGTELRNQGAVCLVVCEGHALPDRQSLNFFEVVAPADLLERSEDIALLAEAEPPVQAGSPVREVRQAILQLTVAERPSAVAVAAYFDAVAAGQPPLQALPALGAFRDDDQGDRVTTTRVKDNLNLSAHRRSDDLQSHGGLADIRRRAERVLARRPGVAAASAVEQADRVMAMIENWDNALLAELAFDEAREILVRAQRTVSGATLQEIDDYALVQKEQPGAAEIPWDRYRLSAERLAGDDEEQRTAAAELLGFDDAENRRCFQTQTRTRIARLLNDRVIRASDPSCPERGLLQAALALEGGLRRIQLVSPLPLAEGSKPSRRNAARALALACAQHRLGALAIALQETFGIEVDPALRLAARPPWDEAFEDAELNRGHRLEPVSLRLYGEAPASGRADSVVLEWRPDLDDLATLRSALLFSEQDALTLATSGAPTLDRFCAGPDAVPETPAPALRALAGQLRRATGHSIERGLDPEELARWSKSWDEAVESLGPTGSDDLLEALSLVGAARGQGAVALTPWAPLKAEWLSEYLDALWSLLFLALYAEVPGDPGEPLDDTARGVAFATAAHYPAYARSLNADRPLLATSETRVWSLYGGPASDGARHGGAALRSVLKKLLQLQPEVAGHLRCAAIGPGAADLLVSEAIALVNARIVGRIEIFCIGDARDERPLADTLAQCDEQLAGLGRDRLELRYLPSLSAASEHLQYSVGAPAVHLALICGLTSEAAQLEIECPPLPVPPLTKEALFIPRTSVRPGQIRRMLLAPPATTESGRAWLRLMHALDDGWPEDDSTVQIAELRTASADLREQLKTAHDLALWVATLDPYASRDSLERAIGPDVAILHQDRRLGGDSPLALVISQKSGGPADRAIGRSLQAAHIVGDRDDALGIGADLRKVASQGYGILALEAATTGSGINELVAHVVAFSLLATTATPWPLPPGCRMLLISLDDYKYWFPAKRADLLVLAIDERSTEKGVHAALVEVKARRSDAVIAATDALDQLRQSLQVTRWAGYPDPETIHSRLWLNRIAEAALAVARESNVRLTVGEIEAIETFRQGFGTLEWAGIGLVFGPNVEVLHRDTQHKVAGDLVPISISAMQLTQQLLSDAAGTNLADLHTAETERAPLGGGRRRRRPERGGEGPVGAMPGVPDEAAPEPGTQETPGVVQSEPAIREMREPEAEPHAPGAESDAPPAEVDTAHPHAGEDVAGAMVEPASGSQAGGALAGTSRATRVPAFDPPILGWDVSTGEPLLWHAAGDQALANGHMEIWGSSGAGKTQFVMALLSQLASKAGARFGVADFKNDYGGDFPRQADAEFLDLWNEGAPYNPLALATLDDRSIRTAVIELRDIVDVATQSFARLGVRQKTKLQQKLAEAFEQGKRESQWPTLRTLDALLDDDLRGVIGDLTSNDLFREGPPLGDVTARNAVFGLSNIPGNGLTTVLAAGFILGSLQLKMQGLPPVPNTLRYAVVVDEAHRVSAFKAIDTMVREGRSKGLAVILATQQPGDLTPVVAANAQTRVCFRLSDAGAATAAARSLDPADRDLPEQIRTLDSGEAYVSLAGRTPLLLSMAQNYRNRGDLGLAP